MSPGSACGHRTRASNRPWRPASATRRTVVSDSFVTPTRLEGRGFSLCPVGIATDQPGLARGPVRQETARQHGVRFRRGSLAHIADLEVFMRDEVVFTNQGRVRLTAGVRAGRGARHPDLRGQRRCRAGPDAPCHVRREAAPGSGQDGRGRRRAHTAQSQMAGPRTPDGHQSRNLRCSLPPEVKLLQEVTPPFFPEGGSGMTVLVELPVTPGSLRIATRARRSAT